ncbi:MAG: ABC transporter permease [Acidobacteria bacterium]|nr:ABC transporter permease [Acidobacteriota bacterium]
MPDWNRYVRNELRLPSLAPAREVEIVEELAAQLEQAYQEALASGRAPDEAERLAKSQLPDWRSLARDIEASEPARRRGPSALWRGVPGDLRHALRILRNSPVFAAVAIATLALGIGGCTAIFGLIDAVVLRPIGYPNAGKLVMVWAHQYKRGFHHNVVAMADYLDWRARNHVFSDMSQVLDQQWNVTGAGGPVVLKGLSVNARFLPMLGVWPVIGRNIRDDEARAGGPAVAIISHRLWTERFAANRDVIGRAITLDGKPHAIVGVLPATFPWLGAPLDVITPVQLPNRDWRVRAGRFLRVVARLRPGVSLTQAQSEMSAIAAQLETEYPQFNKDWGVEIVPLPDHFAGPMGLTLWILMGAVGLLLLIACSNVANLMLARAVVREREMALRAALGATVPRLVRLLMIECLTLAAIGGAIGCAGAWAAIRAIQLYGPRDISRLETAGINIPVALFALGVSVLAGVAFGLAPAFSAGRLNLSPALKDGGRGVLNTIRGERLRSVLATAQIALALVLLTGALLLARSWSRLTAVSPGFDSHNVLTGTVMFSGRMDNGKLSETCREIGARLRQLPGVENAGFITFLPFAGMGAATAFSVVGQPPYAPGQAPTADVRVVQPGYFETMRIPLLKGRLFDEADNRGGAPRRFVVNETLARRMFAAADSLGQSLIVEMGDSKPGEIIGIVADTRHKSLDGEVRPMVYYVQAHLPISFGTFVMRTTVSPESLGPAMTAAIQQVKQDQPVTEVRTMDDWIGDSTARTRLQTAVIAAFAAIAVILAVIGVYGVMAYSVEQRVHEIGVRLALGAAPGSVQRLIAARGLRLAAIGLAIGGAAAAASTRVLKTLLYQVAPNDPAAFAAAAILLGAACVLASYVPARRATHVDPVAALRGE